MNRAIVAVGLAAMLLGCDPVVSDTFRLPPGLAVESSGTVPGASSDRAEMFGTLEALASRFGLAPVEGSRSGCTREWQVEEHAPGIQFLHLCASARADGTLDVRVAEGITTEWSAKGDSLRRAVADSLARFGYARGR